MVDALQTLGICVGALALVVIAYSAFIISTAVVMATDIGEEDDDELAASVVREMNRRMK